MFSILYLQSIFMRSNYSPASRFCSRLSFPREGHIPRFVLNQSLEDLGNYYLSSPELRVKILCRLRGSLFWDKFCARSSIQYYSKFILGNEDVYSLCDEIYAHAISDHEELAKGKS